MTYMANINGAAIEGKSDMPQYVTLIKFKISNDNVHWYDIDGGKSFRANHDNLNRVILFFSKSYYGRYVRFMPIGWTILPSFRAGVIACIRSDHMDDRGMQVPPPPDLEVNAEDNLGKLATLLTIVEILNGLHTVMRQNILMEGMDGSLWIR